MEYEQTYRRLGAPRWLRRRRLRHCANETNKKKTKWRAFSLLRIAGERGRRVAGGGGGGGGGNIQHALALLLAVIV